MGTPVITIFVRHSSKRGKPCKYSGDEFARRCQCRKHLRWTANGKQYRKQAGTRSWEEAEKVKRRIEDQLAGRTPDQRPEDSARGLQEAIDLFIQDKRVQGVTDDRIGRYVRELDRLREHCEQSGVYTVQGITRELLTGYASSWERLYPSTQTRSSVRDRVRSFLRYCYEAQWIQRVPTLPTIKVVEPPTMPLTAEEYSRLLSAVKVLPDPEKQARVRGALQLMRWSGLAIGDALTLRKSEIKHVEEYSVYLIVTARQKTGTDVSVPIPKDVADELLHISKRNPTYIFSPDENLTADAITKSWRKYLIAPVFKAAKIEKGGSMVSHRLRDTFAVDLLSKGVPLEEVSKLLGHESIRTTEKHYAKWVKGRQARLVSLVMGTWGPKATD
jgi:integrase/recombinase XerD